ncbi:MAG: DNA polymerase III subunit gamma/tau [Bacteroidota bacterium]|jgi:DNA polymerase-3 subunit gamma/tau
MSYQVTARKWRPLVFDDVIGQTHVSNTLKNALAQNRLAHAFIFSGTRGCGKTTTARILARAVNCLHPKDFEPCNECEICKEIIDGRSLDIIEIDGASNRGVEEIRNLRESVRYTPTRGKKKVYIIDEVHMLTKEAFNALLKTLEEPPPHVLFIFATTELHKVPATILSRCQRYDFRRISVDEIIGRLQYISSQEGITIDADSLLIIAKKGDGSMRDAQSIFDQVISFCGTTITARQVGDALNIVDQELFFKVSDVLKNKDTHAGLMLINEVIQSGYDLKEFISGAAEHFRNMLIVKSTGSTQLIEESEIHRKRYADDAALFSMQDLLRIIKVVTDAENSLRFSAQPRFKLEVMIVQLTKMEASVNIDELLSELNELKKKLYADGPVTIQSQVQADRIAQIKNEPEQPSPRPVPSFETSKPRYTFTPSAPKSVQEPAKEESSAAPAVILTVTLSDIEREWNGVVDGMRKKKISVGTILGETTPIEIVDGTLRLACSDEFHRSTILRNKDIVAEAFNSVLSSRLRIDPFIRTDEQRSMPKERQPRSDSQQSAASPSEPSSAEDHPVIKTLIKDFGVERIS